MGGLQEAINKVTAENSPGADKHALHFITSYIQRSPAKGSDKALKYLKKRFDLKHVKVQNLTLIVLDTCQKKCGHMFRERVPCSDLFADLIKVATLKRKVDGQIYNKVLALIEDWAEALEPPSYKQAHHQLKMGSVQFPNRVGRDLTEYQNGGDNHWTATGMVGDTGYGSPAVSPVGAPPYSYGGNGHFGPPASPKSKPESGSAAGLPENMLAPGQPSHKLHEDLTAARNSVDLLAQMLAPISLKDPAAVKQDLVKELAGRCEDMLPKLAALAEEVTDEHNLDQTLVLHADMEESVAKYHSLLQTAEGKTPMVPLQKRSLSQKLASKSAALKPAAALIPAKATSPKKEVTVTKKEVNLLDWDDEPPSPQQQQLPNASAPASAAAQAPPSSGSAAGAPAALATAALPSPKATDFNSVMSLFDVPQQPLHSASEPVEQHHGPPSSGFGQPDFRGPGGLGQPNFGGPSGPFNQPNFGPPSAGINAGSGSGFGQPNMSGQPSVGPPGGSSFGGFDSFGPSSFLQQPLSPQLQLDGAGSGHPHAGWQSGVPEQQQPQSNPFGGEGGPHGVSAAPHSFGGPHFGQDPQQNTVSTSSVAGSSSGGAPQWNAPHMLQQQQQGPNVPQHQPSAIVSGFLSGDMNAFSGKAGGGDFLHSDNSVAYHDRGLIAAVKGPSSLAGSVGSVNPFDDPPHPANPAAGGAKPPPSKLGAGGAAPKPSWSSTVPAEDDPFSSIGPSFSALKPAKA